MDVMSSRVIVCCVECVFIVLFHINGEQCEDV